MFIQTADPVTATPRIRLVWGNRKISLSPTSPRITLYQTTTRLVFPPRVKTKVLNRRDKIRDLEITNFRRTKRGRRRQSQEYYHNFMNLPSLQEWYHNKVKFRNAVRYRHYSSESHFDFDNEPQSPIYRTLELKCNVLLFFHLDQFYSTHATLFVT